MNPTSEHYNIAQWALNGRPSSLPIEQTSTESIKLCLKYASKHIHFTQSVARTLHSSINFATKTIKSRLKTSNIFTPHSVQFAARTPNSNSKADKTASRPTTVRTAVKNPGTFFLENTAKNTSATPKKIPAAQATTITEDISYFLSFSF